MTPGRCPGLDSLSANFGAWLTDRLLGRRFGEHAVRLGERGPNFLTIGLVAIGVSVAIALLSSWISKKMVGVR